MTLVEWLVANPAILSLICTAIGGIAIKGIEWLMARDGEQREDRKEYREEWSDLLARIDKLEAEIDSWRSKYYEVMDQNIELKKLISRLENLVPPEVRDDA